MVLPVHLSPEEEITWKTHTQLHIGLRDPFIVNGITCQSQMALLGLM